MAINYTVSTFTRASWSGTFDVSDSSLPVLTEVPVDITFEPGSFNFNLNSTELFLATINFSQYADSNVKYVTWRTYLGTSQYPDSGYSFDVWSDDLYDAIIGNATWDDLVSTGTFNLNSDKNTLIYNYDSPGLPFDFYGKGGIITFG